MIINYYHNWLIGREIVANKIVLIGYLSGYGGAQRALTVVANGLARLGNEVSIISFQDDQNTAYDIEDNVKIVYIPDQRGSRFYKMIRRFFKLRTALVEIKPDICISFWLQPAIYTAIICKFLKIKTVYSERSNPKGGAYKGLAGVFRGLFLRYMDGYVFQTNVAKKCFSKSIQNKSTVIQNPVHIGNVGNTKELDKRKVIVNVGRLHHQKNQFLLINSFSKITDKFPEYKLEIYGDGELRNELENHISKLDLENKVILKGTTNQIYKEIKNSSLFILSSDYEGMPNALLEAMALGIPCISTNYDPGGVEEIIKNGHNGLICAKNSVDQLAEAIQFMLSNPHESNRMGENAKNISKTNSIENIMIQWNEYINKIIEGTK